MLKTPGKKIVEIIVMTLTRAKKMVVAITIMYRKACLIAISPVSLKEQTNEQTLNERTNERTNERLNEQEDRRTKGQKDGRTDGGTHK